MPTNRPGGAVEYLRGLEGLGFGGGSEGLLFRV